MGNRELLRVNGFPSCEWFRCFTGFLEADEDFRKHGQWFTERVGFRVDQDLVVLAFDRGLVLDVSPGLASFDILIAGTRPRWNVLLETGWGLVRLHRTGTLEIRADPVRLMQNWKPLFFVTEAMRRFVQSI